MNFNTNSSAPIDRGELRRKIQILCIAFTEWHKTSDLKVVNAFDPCARGTVAHGCRRCWGSAMVGLVGMGGSSAGKVRWALATTRRFVDC